MSSIGSLLSIARSAIAAHQTALQTVSHNIANAETDGYSRQRVELATGTPVQFTYGTIGTGVIVGNITRARQPILDANYHAEAGAAEGYALRRDILSEIEGVFGEPSKTGLSAGLDAFWNAWSDLANNPGNPIAQGSVRHYGGQLAQMLNTFDGRLTQVAEGTRSRLLNAVDELNQYSRQVADLNVRILASEAGGNQAPDLRDARDRIADKMAQIAGTRAVVQADGTMAVLLNGTTLVDQANARTIEVRNGQPITIGLTGRADPLPRTGGILDATLTVLNVDIPALRGRLDALAAGVVKGVNFLHQQGWTAAGDALGNANWDPLAGPTGSRVNFFDPTRTTAATIALSDEVRANAAVVASGATPNGPGDNAIAQALAALRDGNGLATLRAQMGDTLGLAAGESFNDQFRHTITQLGIDQKAATSDADVHQILASQADQRRQSMSGVSMDEELTLLMRHQQAFVAASRLARVADEMAQAVLQMV